MKNYLQEHFAHFFEHELLQEIEKCGTLKSFKEGQIIMDIGLKVSHMPLLISGAIKVMREDENGDELLLYFIESGETCAMTLTCCVGDKKSEVRAVAEKDTQLLMIPVQKMDQWMTQYYSWRNFVLNSYQNRLDEMLNTIDKIAFLNMDQRLWNYLTEKARINNTNQITTTHQEIAFDLHTSRVVISRLLKTLEKNQKISLSRNTIQINL